MVGTPTDAQGEPRTLREEGELRGTAVILPPTVSTKRSQDEALNTNCQVMQACLLSLFAIEMR